MRTFELATEDITYRRTFQGAWELSAIIDGVRVHQQYMGYTRAEATSEFKRYCAERAQ